MCCVCHTNEMCKNILSVPLTWSMPMWRAFSGSELSRWNLTAENKSPPPMAASAKVRHSSNEGRPHWNEDTQSQSLWSSEMLVMMQSLPEHSGLRRLGHSPCRAADQCRQRFRGKKRRVWPVKCGCQGSSAAGQQTGPYRRQKNVLWIQQSGWFIVTTVDSFITQNILRKFNSFMTQVTLLQTCVYIRWVK